VNSSCVEVLTTTQRRLRNTEVYGLLQRIEKAVRARVTFAKFRDSIRERFATTRPESEVPADSVLQLIYERAVEAKVDRLWLRRLQQIYRSSEWKTHRDWLDKSIKLTRELTKILRQGDSRPISSNDARKIESAAQSIEGLQRRLLGIQKWDQHLAAWAKVSYRNLSLKQLRLATDRILMKKCPSLNQTERAELIALVVETAGLKTEEMPEAVARQLRRTS
jgi:hypothetical protein